LFLLFKKKLSLNGKNLLLKPKKTAGTACPANLSDAANCNTAHGAVATAATSWASITAVETAINDYLKACPASQCQTDCIAVIGSDGRQVVDADNPASSGTLASSFASGCVPPSPVNTKATTCSGTPTNGDTCTAAYSNVVTAAGATPWTPATIKEKVDLYIDGCVAASCNDLCKPIVSGVNLALPFKNFVANFTSLCNPDKPPSGGGGDDGEKNNDSGFFELKPNISLIFILMINVFVTFICS
jgi:hypothetical protein